ncbi:hypothetical protein KAT08_00805 [Candidatus Babeliales bacterium]|nr:hypothetical protein [Candidatus Babeliales bacterium]
MKTIFEFPNPTGKYSVGIISYWLKDLKRKEAHALNDNVFRELLIQIWYPSDKEKNNSNYPYNLKELSFMKDSMQKNYFYYFPRFLFDYFLSEIYTHAIPNLKLSKSQEKYPILIFSHGYASLSSFNSTQLEELASHGYVVVGVNHTYDCHVTIFPDGRIIPLSDDWKKGEIQYLSKEIDTWINDVTFVLDELEKINKNDPKNIFTRKLNFDQIGIFGHSMGGATATQVCRIDNRIKAGINMDGPLFGKNPTKVFSKPFMFLLAQNTLEKLNKPLDKKELDYRKMSQEEGLLLKKLYQEYIQKLFCKMKKDSYCIVLKGAGHFTFSDMPFIKKISLFLKHFDFEIGTIDPYRAINITNEYILSFFNKYLKKEKNPLFDGNRKYPEMQNLHGRKI